MTNAEMLRNMTDFELASFVCDVPRCPEWRHKPSCINNCHACWYQWMTDDVRKDEEDCDE